MKRLLLILAVVLLPGPAGAVSPAGSPGPAGPTEPTEPTGLGGLSGLPLVEVPAVAGSGGQGLLAVFFSGAGGWAALDRGVARGFAERGVPVVGWSTSSYLGDKRTPDGAARDLERVVRHYLEAWHEREVLLVGYSMGAEILPFLAARLPRDLRAKVRLVALLGPSTEAVFEFHALDWLRSGYGPGALPVRPEVEKLGDLSVLCLYGEDEEDSLCPLLARPDLPPGAPRLAKVVALAGGHHFGGGYAHLADVILSEAGLGGQGSKGER